MTEQKVGFYANFMSITDIKKDIEEWLKEGYIVRAFLERGHEVLAVYEREVNT